MGKVRVSYSVFKGGGEQVLYAEHLMTALYKDQTAFAEYPPGPDMGRKAHG